MTQFCTLFLDIYALLAPQRGGHGTMPLPGTPLNVLTGATSIVRHANRCYCAQTGLARLAVKMAMLLSPLITVNFFKKM